jgi:hypothetical protein
MEEGTEAAYYFPVWTLILEQHCGPLVYETEHHETTRDREHEVVSPPFLSLRPS